MYTFEELLFQFSLGDLNLYGFVNLFRMTALVIGVILDGCREEGVDEGGLSKPRFTSNLSDCYHLLSMLRRHNGVLTIIVKAAPRFATILCLHNG